MAKQLTTDEESILKRQARRRLIGAVALTTAVVVILPLVFDSEPPANIGNNIELSIAGQEKTKELPVVSAVVVVSPVSAVVEPAISASSVIVSTPVSSVPVATTVVPVPVVPLQALKSNPAKLEAEKPVTVEPEKTEVKPRVEAKPKAEIPANVEAKPKSEKKLKAEVKPKAESKSAVLAHAVPHSGYVVQIGAYSNSASAKNMQERLTKQGFHVYTEKVGANVRVRVGSFSTREAAEKVRRKLEALKLHPDLVNLGG
jgi:DedD protein